MATEAQRRARNRNNAKNQVTKTVAFYRSTEGEMIEYVESLNEKFTTYVKSLIKKDMMQKRREEK